MCGGPSIEVGKRAVADDVENCLGPVLVADFVCGMGHTWMNSCPVFSRECLMVGLGSTVTGLTRAHAAFDWRSDAGFHFGINLTP